MMDYIGPPKVTGTETRTIQLTDDQRGLLIGLVRAAIRKTEKSHKALRQRLGRAYDPVPMKERMAFLDGIYEELGGDRAYRTSKGPAR